MLVSGSLIAPFGAQRMRPSPRDMSVVSGRLANLTPETLSGILNNAERGELRDWADLCDRMAEVDAQVRASLETRVAAIAGARCVVEPGPPTGDPRRDRYREDAAQFFENVLAQTPDWSTRVMELLDGIPKGVGVLQKTWAWDGHAVMPTLTWVHTRRFRWFRDDWTLRLADDGNALWTPGLELDPDEWIVHAPKTVAGYPTRVGVMRAVAWAYLFKRWCAQFWIQGAERFAWPLLWAKVPRGAAADVRATAQQGLDDLSADHAAVVEDPVAFQLIETTVKDNGTWKTFHEAMNNEIAKAILGMTDMNEPGRIGAYAAVEVRRGATVDARIAMDELSLASTIRGQLAEPCIRLNAHLFGGYIPPIPSARWVVSAKRTPIPKDREADASLNERRRSIDLDPLPGGDDVPALVAIVEQNAARKAASQVGPDESVTEVVVGSKWIDTRDGHRIEVTAVADGSVYFVDQDDPNPSWQYRWALRTFLERCRMSPAPSA